MLATCLLMLVALGTCDSKAPTLGSRTTNILDMLLRDIREVICQSGTNCPPGNTCCVTKASSFGCCPLPNAVCCSDGVHCCPHGYTCQQGHCTR